MLRFPERPPDEGMVMMIAPLAKCQAASEEGGQHWTVKGNDIYGIANVRSGDLVVGMNNCLVGVALTDYNIEAGEVALDITGCWWMAVLLNNGGITIGDWIYFHAGGPTPYLDNQPTAGKPVGQALDTFSPVSGTIDVPVKLCPCAVDNRQFGP